MALIVICGLPNSGKSSFARELKKNLESNILYSKVFIIGDEEYIVDKNELYKDKRLEMELRQRIKAEVKRILDRETVVIVDSTNYIKSFRYELYCIAKSMNLKYCVVYCCNSNDGNVSIHNPLYEQTTLDAVLQRFEEPSENDRWDMPLFTVDPSSENINYIEISNGLFNKNKNLVPNIATKNQTLPLTYIQDMDEITQNMVKEILACQRKDEIFELPNKSKKLNFKDKKITMIELYKYKGDFLNMINNNFSSKIDKGNNLLHNIQELFMDYIEEQISLK